MKKLILLSGFIAFALLFIAASDTKTSAIPVTPGEYFNFIIQGFFGYEDYSIIDPMPNDFPDPLLHYTVDGVDETTGNDVHLEVKVRRYCTVSPSIIYYMFYLPLDSTAYWNVESFSYNTAMKENFKHLFGEDILKDQVVLPDRKSGNAGVLRLFNGKAFRVAFNKLYKKPRKKFQGLILGKIYNVTLKDYCRDAADIISHVLSNKALFQQWADNYLLLAKTDTTFDGVKYEEKAADTLIGKALYAKLNCCTSGDRLVGTMLRRQIDGSLPDLLYCFKTVLHDYDPEYYKKIKDTF
jgi:hypothetical protein